MWNQLGLHATRINWLHGQAVKTPPFHGGNRGSNPLGVTESLFKIYDICKAKF